jgi:hypothetical protein
MPRRATGGQAENLKVVTSSFQPAGAELFVLQLDTLLDDGNPTTGSMRAIGVPPVTAGTASTIAEVNANQGGLFTVCLSV